MQPDSIFQMVEFVHSLNCGSGEPYNQETIDDYKLCKEKIKNRLDNWTESYKKWKEFDDKVKELCQIVYFEKPWTNFLEWENE